MSRLSGRALGCVAPPRCSPRPARDVTVVEREKVAAGASGGATAARRPAPARSAARLRLHHETLALHREVVPLAEEPDGPLLPSGPRAPTALPDDVRPEVLEDAHEAEPLLRAGVPAVLLRYRLGRGAGRGHPGVVGPRVWSGRAPGWSPVTAGRRTPGWCCSPLRGVDRGRLAAVGRDRPRAAAMARAPRPRGGGRPSRPSSRAPAVSSSASSATCSAARSRPRSPTSRRPGVASPSASKRFVGAVDVTSARACPRPQSSRRAAARRPDRRGRLGVRRSRDRGGISVGPVDRADGRRRHVGRRAAARGIQKDPLRFSA